MTTFLIGLLLKIAMTAGIVVAASIVVERSGPFIGALIGWNVLLWLVRQQRRRLLQQP